MINLIVCYYGLQDSIVTNRSSFFGLEFWSSLCYFLGIKHWFSFAFYLQTNSQTIRQNNTMKAYLQVFVNFKQNNWAKLLPMATFAYNNAKNANTNHIPFELNCGYHHYVSFEKDTNLRSWLKTADKLSTKLQKLMIVCQKNPYHAQKL